MIIRKTHPSAGAFLNMGSWHNGIFIIKIFSGEKERGKEGEGEEERERQKRRKL